eukprot:6211866-Pleurochrysis_carterae.AAC.3
MVKLMLSNRCRDTRISSSVEATTNAKPHNRQRALTRPACSTWRWSARGLGVCARLAAVAFQLRPHDVDRRLHHVAHVDDVVVGHGQVVARQRLAEAPERVHLERPRPARRAGTRADAQAARRWAHSVRAGGVTAERGKRRARRKASKRLHNTGELSEAICKKRWV